MCDANMARARASEQVLVHHLDIHGFSTLQNEISQLNARLENTSKARLLAENQAEEVEQNIAIHEEQLQQHLDGLPAQAKNEYLAAQAEVRMATLLIASVHLLCPFIIAPCKETSYCTILPPFERAD
jgi:Tfp pilus assembly protein PilN